MMKRLAITAAAVLAVFTPRIQSQQAPVFRGESDTVPVYVTVTDRQDRLVTTLTRDDFQVFDNGKPQPVTLFDNTPRPIRLSVMLDVSGSMEGNLPLLKGASDALFARLGQDDRVRVGSFGATVAMSPTFTRNVNELRAALPATIDPQAGTPLWRASKQAIEAFSADDDRRVILLLSDGDDSRSFNFRERLVTPLEVIDLAREKSVMIYGVGLKSRSRNFSVSSDPNPELARTALESGGGYLEIGPRDDLSAAFARVADELHSQYLLGFTPTVRDGKTHKLEIKLTAKDMKARARKEYVAPKR